MTHLTPAQAVDVAAGAAAPALIAHAASCEPCRAKVESLLEAVRLAAEDPPPDPSLFWPHLAARIGEAVRREQAPAPSWRPWLWRLVPAGSFAALVLAVGVGFRLWIGTPGTLQAAWTPRRPHRSRRRRGRWRQATRPMTHPGCCQRPVVADEYRRCRGVWRAPASGKR